MYGDVIDDLVFSLDVQSLFKADARIEENGPTAAPSMPVTLRDDGTIRYDPIQLRDLRSSLDDDELAELITGLRSARLLPLSRYQVRPMQVLLGFLEEEARTRIRTKRRRRTIVARYGASSWESVDLLAEVRAFTGQDGELRGSTWWFFCPFGHSSGRTPSLHVDAERRIFKCFGCPRSGGVLDWARATGAAA